MVQLSSSAIRDDVQLLHVTRAESTNAAALAAVQAGVTERAVLVSLSEVVTEKSVLEPFQTQRGWRRPAVNGVLASFDRQTGKLSWTRPIHNRIVPLDQPRDWRRKQNSMAPA